MGSTKWTQIENVIFHFTKHFDVKYSHTHQFLNIKITYSNTLENTEELFLDDNRTTIYTVDASMIKKQIIAMLTLHATETNNILRITNLLN